MLPHNDIFQKGQNTVHAKLMQGHSARQRTIPQEPGGQGNVISFVGNQPRQRFNQCGGVLIVRMEQDDNIGPPPQGLPITTLLISAVASILFMADHLIDPQVFGDLHRPIPAGVIHQNDFVNDVSRHLPVGPFQRFFRLIRRHRNDNFFASDHRKLPPCFPPSIMLYVSPLHTKGNDYTDFEDICPQDGCLGRIPLQTVIRKAES